MSYAGVYGPDETCRHGSYWRSCSACSDIGPRATDQQIQAKYRRHEEERKQRLLDETRRRGLYLALNPTEKRVADAFWKRFRKGYPGVGNLKISDAVEGRADSWAVGNARSICNDAKIAFAAMTEDQTSDA
ncbi:MAG TPA: hypothetical protein VLE72_03395 [Candidatus Saccharimonadales bacterium]|nr:hypothetical protein [Candidatus Saccharimonadales bacterium]